MKNNREEMIPQIVEERLQEVYGQIRRGEIVQMKKQKKIYKSWVSIAAAVVLIILIPSAVYAAVACFQKSERRSGDELTYEFELNYELIPGEYQVSAGYLPEGFADNGSGQYRSADDDRWITIMPVYTTAELDQLSSGITVKRIDEVERTELSGMPADVITFQEAEKYQSDTWIFMFNESAGYVLNLIAGHAVERDELLKFADSLKVERTGDGHFETEDEKLSREQKESDSARREIESRKNWDALAALGIPEGKIAGVGEELFSFGNAYSYMITDYGFTDSMDGFEEKDFFDFSRFEGWLNEDGTLRPYTRMHYDKNGELLEEVQTEQEFLRVNVKVHCYDDTEPDVPLELTLQYITRTPDGALTWAEDSYHAVPEENYTLQMDQGAVYLDKAVHTEGEKRSHFFYRDMKSGEDLEYTLLFVVDQDRKDDFLLYRTGENSALWQTETMTAGEIRDGLEGYISLQR